MRRVSAASALVVLAALLAAVGAFGAGSAATETSTNWAGYAVMSLDPTTPTSFTSVTGTWTQVAATCDATTTSAASAFWVGLGGYSTTSQALEQIGTDADCTTAGKPVYYAWYEIVPDPPVNLKFVINAGDTITTSVNISGSTVLLQLKDRTRRTTFTRRVTATTLDQTSAEWIAEAPSDCAGQDCKPVPLANFGSVAFSRIAATGNGIGGTLTSPTWTAVPIQLVPNARGGGYYPGPERGFASESSTAGTSAPLGLTPDGRGFTLSWLSDATPNT